jgi:hypothetical protein
MGIIKVLRSRWFFSIALTSIYLTVFILCQVLRVNFSTYAFHSIYFFIGGLLAVVLPEEITNSIHRAFKSVQYSNTEHLEVRRGFIILERIVGHIFLSVAFFLVLFPILFY